MKKRTTAKELMASLNEDPAFVAGRARREEERQRRESDMRLAEAPLVEELRKVGITLASVWDLVNSTKDYTKGLPILLDNLQRPYPSSVLEGIARALAVPEARIGWPVMIRLYKNEQDHRVKSGLAAAIAAASGDEVLEDMIELVKDSRHGSSRVLLLSALERSADPRARATLMEVSPDPELHKEVRVILSRLKKKKR